MRQLVKNSIWSSLIGLVCFGAACQPTATTTADLNGNSSNAKVSANSNANANAATSTNANAVNSSANTPQASGEMIETKEPEQYQATVTLKFAVAGAQNAATAPLKANVARNGNDRQMEFTLPTGEKLIYLDIGGKQFVVSPSRKQYAELNKESIGVDPRRMLMPEQIVNQVKNLKGVERVGEEKVGGRYAIKYRYGATTDTKSQAGTVETESVVLVDKETGLPLRSTIDLTSQNGNVQGMKGLSVVTEMTELRMSADADLFKEPTDYKKVAPEEIKGQVNMIFSAAAALLGQLMNSAK